MYEQYKSQQRNIWMDISTNLENDIHYGIDVAIEMDIKEVKHHIKHLLINDIKLRSSSIRDDDIHNYY